MFGRKPKDIELNYSFTCDLMDNNYRSALMVSLDRKNYVRRMEEFRERFEDALVSADAKLLIGDMLALTSKKGKVSSFAKHDTGLYLIYYILPSIELSEAENKLEQMNAIVDEWRQVADAPEFNYQSYEMIVEGFQTTIMGIPLEVFGGKKKSEK